MKKAFTLVELLIVVVVLVTLMAVTFRLSSIGSNQTARNKTVSRLQKLENCLSGYYAAFGTYPPVRLHGSRNYTLEVSRHGIQNLDGDAQPLAWSWFDQSNHRVTDGTKEAEDWAKVEAACKAQPVDCRYPFSVGDGSGNGWNNYVTAISEQLKKKLDDAGSGATDEQRTVFSAGFDDGVSQNIGRHGAGRDLSEWREVQLFKFGLMSFLLPRYLVMMGSAETLYSDYEQWRGNNSCPSDPLTGQAFSWRTLREKATSEDETDIARVANIPSQAVTARWMPNLEKICNCSHNYKLFGVDIKDPDVSGIPINFNLEVFAPSSGSGGEGSGGGSTSGQYILDGVTIHDGWGREVYYYCPAPYQTYVLWSAGPNGRTFPPWVSRDKLSAQANACVGYWTEDDIVNLRQ